MTQPLMEYNFLGKTGVKVSNICLGTLTFGQSPDPALRNPRNASEELSHQIMDAYASYGGNFLDTANTYTKGVSEKIVGSWLAKQDRSKSVLATKVRSPMDNLNSVGLSRRHIVESCEQSLERLQTNYIDLYQSHIWDAATNIDETLRTFDDLVRCGKIRYFGASNVCGWQIQKIVDRIEAMGLNSCVSLQQQYNLLVRQSEFEEFMVCEQEGIGVLPWSPLKGGLLTGKYKRDVKQLNATESRLGYGQSKKISMQSLPDWDEYVENEKYWKLMDTLTEISAAHDSRRMFSSGNMYQKREILTNNSVRDAVVSQDLNFLKSAEGPFSHDAGKTIPQVAIRWLLQKDVVTSVIIGATSVKQLEDNVGASSGWKLSKEEMTRLDENSVRLMLYPYEMIWKFNGDRMNRYNRSCKI